MMNNLFSIFDPSSAFLSMNWTVFFMILLTPFFMKNKPSTFIKTLKLKLSSEIEDTFMKNHTKPSLPFFLAFLLIFMLSNYLSLLPHIFSSTSHLMTNWPLALSIWGSFMMFYIITSPKMFFSHLVPLGTPSPLMPIMVLIEIISNTIRPVTLSVRLTANMIAGHLLMSLLGSSCNFLTLYSSLISIPMLLLTLLEIMVAMIQSYVFMTLISLYSAETK